MMLNTWSVWKVNGKIIQNVKEKPFVVATASFCCLFGVWLGSISLKVQESLGTPVPEGNGFCVLIFVNGLIPRVIIHGSMFGSKYAPFAISPDFKLIIHVFEIVLFRNLHLIYRLDCYVRCTPSLLFLVFESFTSGVNRRLFFTWNCYVSLPLVPS